MRSLAEANFGLKIPDAFSTKASQISGHEFSYDILWSMIMFEQRYIHVEEHEA